MKNSVGVSTPMFRTALIRKLRNVAPGYKVEILLCERGIAFRMIDRAGRYRSEIVNIYVNRGHALDRSNLQWLLRRVGFSKVFRE